MSTYSSTVVELIRQMSPDKPRPRAEIVQIDANTVRVRINGSTNYLSGVTLVGATLASVSIGDQIDLDIIDGQPFGYLLVPTGSSIVPSGHGRLTIEVSGDYAISVHGSGSLSTGSGQVNQVSYWSGQHTLTGDSGFTFDAATDTIGLDGPLDLIGLASAPITPAGGRFKMYFKSDGYLYRKDSAGVETLLSDGLATGVSGSGAAARLAFWSGTTNITSSASLLYDDTTKELYVLGSVKADKELNLKQIATPANPAGGYNKLYPKSDNHWYTLTSAGVETQIDGAGVSDGDKGDITVSSSGATWTVDSGVVSLAKMANMATASFLGRNTAGTGTPEVLAGTQATALLDTFTSLLKGLVPASGGGTTNYLRADGTWAAPAGGSSAAEIAGRLMLGV